MCGFNPQPQEPHPCPRQEPVLTPGPKAGRLPDLSVFRPGTGDEGMTRKTTSPSPCW